MRGFDGQVDAVALHGPCLGLSPRGLLWGEQVRNHPPLDLTHTGSKQTVLPSSGHTDSHG